MEECPSNTIIENFVCKENVVDKCTSGENQMNDNIIINKEKTETFVRTYISEFNYTNNHVVLYTSNKYKIIIYKNKDCINNLEMPNVDFKECYNKVKNEYQIEEELVKVIISLKGNNGEIQNYYSFFHPITGYKLNVEEICQNETIVVYQNLNNILGEKGYENYELRISLTSQGINIFDLNHPFYTDLCYDFYNPINRDIPLSKRISTVYPNTSVCEEGCILENINLENLVASCDCKFHDIGNKDLMKNNVFLENTFEKIFEIINSSSILVVKCYKYIFKRFTKSIGGIIVSIAIALHLIYTAFYFIFGKKQIINYAYGLFEKFTYYINKEETIIPSFLLKRKQEMKILEINYSIIKKKFISTKLQNQKGKGK